jgi:ATP-dependent DNA helicase RecG
MSVAPIPFHGNEKEPPFDVDSVRKILTELIVSPADDVESEQLEIKGWCRSDRDLAEHVSEACCCIANAAGGFVLVGVEEGPGRKFSPCPHRCVSSSWLTTSIHNQTQPPVECVVHDVSWLATEVLGAPGNTLFVVRVPRTRHISGHTHKGVSKVRIGKQCQPQYVAEDDRTGVTVPEISADDLLATSVDWGMAQHAKHFRNFSEWVDRSEFLAQARLVEPRLLDEEYTPRLRLSLAALLLFGKPAALARHAPAFETSIVTREGTTRIRKNIVESVRDLCFGEDPLLRGRLPRLRPDVLKELVVNAYVHRCYRTPAHVTIRLDETSLEIQSPGQLLAGLTVSNLINGVPVYRNLLLADGARFIGLCDKIGQGIDLVYRGVLSDGFAFPEFESGNNAFVARLSLSESREFSEFVKKRAQALSQLEEIIALRLLWQRESAKLSELVPIIQRREDVVMRLLEQMCRKGMADECDWHTYRLSPIVREDIKNIFRSSQLDLGIDMWGEPQSRRNDLI